MDDSCFCVYVLLHWVGRYAKEPFSLWKDAEALEAFCFHWKLFAERYRGIPSEQLSFNLLNEPPALRDEVMTGDSCRYSRSSRTLRK